MLIIDNPSLVKVLETATQSDLTLINSDAKTFIDHLTEHQLPEAIAQWFYTLQVDIENGVLDSQSTDLADVLGKPLTSLPTALSEILNIN